MLLERSPSACWRPPWRRHADERNQTLAFYGLGPFVAGDITFGEVGSGDIDVDASDIIDSLEFAATLRYRAQSERWAFVLDGQFVGLGDTEEGPPKQDLDLDLLVAQADVAYRLSDTTEVLFGARYLEFEAAIDVTGPLQAEHREGDESFVDGVVGLRTGRRMGERWRFQAQGDVGTGDMDLSWQGMLNFGYQASDAISLWIGYRALGLDFEEGVGPDRVDADLVVHGPVVGLAFDF